MSDRVRSTKRRHAVVISQPLGSSGYSSGHVFDGPDQRLLDGVFGGREVGPAVDEGRQDAGDQLPQLGLVPRVRGVTPRIYSVTVVGAPMNGRTSSHSWIGLPPAPGAADNSPASSTARS